MIFTSAWVMDFINVYLANLQEFGQTLDIQVLLEHIQGLLASLSPLLNLVSSVSDFIGDFKEIGTVKSDSLKAGISEFGVSGSSLQSSGWIEYLKNFIKIP